MVRYERIGRWGDEMRGERGKGVEREERKMGRDESN